MTRRERVAWAAGFFDGEGCIYAAPPNRHKRSYIVQVTAHQVVRAPIDELCALFGGSCYPRPARGRQVRDCHQWTLSGSEKIGRALREMLPHLKVKAEQATLALALLSAVPAHGQHCDDPAVFERQREMADALKRAKR